MRRRNQVLIRCFVSACCAAAAVCVILATVYPDGAHAARDYGGYTWKLEGNRIYTGESGGKWAVGIRAKAEGTAGDTISMSSSKSVSNSVSGSLDIPPRKLNAKFQFNVSRQWSASATKAYGLSDKKKGSWWAIKYKRVYRNYKVKARKYSFYDGVWHRTGTTRWVRAKKFAHFAYMLSPSRQPAGKEVRSWMLNR